MRKNGFSVEFDVALGLPFALHMVENIYCRYSERFYILRSRCSTFSESATMATEWYYLINGEKYGPVSSSELKKLAVNKKITPEDLIWKAGLVNWVAAKSIKQLFDKVDAGTSTRALSEKTFGSNDSKSMVKTKSAISDSPVHLSEKISSPPLPIEHIEEIPSDEEHVGDEELDLITYCWRYYTDSHTISPNLVGLFLGIISLPIISLLKPRLGVNNIWYVFVCFLCAGTVLLIFQFVTAIIKFIVLRQRSLPDYRLRWISSLTAFLLTVTILMGISAVAETFSPEHGLFTKLIPKLRVEQDRLLALLDNATSSNSDRESTDNVDWTDTKHNNSSALKENYQSLVKSDQPDLNDKKVSVESNTKIKNASGNVKDLVASNETPERKVTKSVRNSVATNDQKPDNENYVSDNSGTQNVIAEGSGASEKEALIDAYRNAVRQVVGAVVDAETLVKDDVIIDDKVLTYSDGFIKTYEDFAGSKSVKSGIHRIKIKAVVQRRSIVAKLKAANVSLKEVDGKGMLAELLSKQSGEASATELIKKSLADLPTLLTAEISGKPDFDRTTSEVVVMVEVTPDEKAYQAFVTRLEETLTKVAISKDSVILKAVNQKTENSMGQKVDGPDEFLVVNDASSLGGPKSPNAKPGDQVWGLWVCSFTSGKHKSQTWNGYVLPGDPKKCFIPLLMPEVNANDSGNESGSDNVTAKPSIRRNNSKTNLRLVLLDNDGKTVTEDLRELTIEEHNLYRSGGNSQNRRPLMRSGVFQEIGGKDGFKSSSVFESFTYFLDEKKMRFNGLIAPFFFQPSYNNQNSILLCSTKRIVEFRLKVTEEELKRFDAAKVEISFSE